METIDVRVLRGAALPTAVAGALAIVLAFALGGGQAALGAVVGAALVGAFFTVGMVAMSSAARISAAAMMQVALATYLVKIVTLGLLLLAFGDTTAFDVESFAWTVVACTLVWIAAQVRAFSKQRIPYVDPGGGP